MQVEEVEEVEDLIEENKEEIEELEEEIKEIEEKIEEETDEDEIEEMEEEIEELEEEIDKLNEEIELMEELLEEFPVFIGDAHKSVAILKQNGEEIAGKKMLEVTDFLSGAEIVEKQKNVMHNGKIMDRMIIKNPKSGATVKIWATYKGFGEHIETEKYTIRKNI